MHDTHDFPPNFQAILKVFPEANKHGVLFCYGDQIYNPSRIDIPQYLVVHENVHRLQQGDRPGLWWEKYLVNPEFRLAQEIPAHQAEYEAYGWEYPNRTLRRMHLKEEAKRLSGPLYGNMISFEKAKAIIKTKGAEA